MRWRALGIAIIASAVAGCGEPAAPSSSSQPTAIDTASPPPASAAPTLAPTPTAGPAAEVVVPSMETPVRRGTAGLDWARQHVDEGVFGIGLAHGPGGWVHLLFTDGEIPVTPDVVLSADLRSWETVTPPGNAVSCGDSGSIAATTTTWLLRCDELFRSSDGRTWKPVPDLADSVRAELRHLVSDGRSFVAWRRDYPADEAIWTSTDGSAWTRIELPGAPFVRVDAMIGRPTGGFILAGRVAATAMELLEAHDMQWYSLPGTQAIWTSPDGLAWTALDPGSTFERGRITGLAADGPGGGVLAVGYLGENREDNVRQEVAFWRSPDLHAWQRLRGVALDVLEPEVGQVRVLATAERWLVVGARLQVDAESAWDLTPLGVTAGSEDGAAWWTIWPIELTAGASLDAIIPDGDRLVALANQAAYSTGGGVGSDVWVSPPLD